MTPSRASGLSTFEWLCVLGTTIGIVGAAAAWALNTFTPRTETELMREDIKETRKALYRVERRQLGEQVPVPRPGQ